MSGANGTQSNEGNSIPMYYIIVDSIVGVVILLLFIIAAAIIVSHRISQRRIDKEKNMGKYATTPKTTLVNTTETLEADPSRERTAVIVANNNTGAIIEDSTPNPNNMQHDCEESYTL